MAHLIHNARFVLAGMPDAEAAGERLRDKFAASARGVEPYQLSRGDIAANGDGVKLALILREELPTGVSATGEAWSQARVEAALAWLVERLECCPTWGEAHESAQVSGRRRMTASAGGSAEYQV